MLKSMSEKFISDQEYWRLREEANKQANPSTPEEILGVSAHANMAEVEQAYAQRVQRLENERAEGQKGEGGRVIPDQEFAERMAKLKNAYDKIVETAAGESNVSTQEFNSDEIDTQELDPDYLRNHNLPEIK